MGCGGRRSNYADARPEQKWDYISLNDFKSTSCFTPFAYGYLWFSLFLSVAVYAVDTFTAYNLLVVGKWTSAIALTQLLDQNISRWIFTGCIILSFVNLGFEHIRARRIMNRGSVAECYLDSLAVRLESTRFGKGRGWKRFLVFAELTKSKKGAEYVALFTYFSFQSWLRVLLCSGPRQVINALSLYSIYNAKLEIANADFEHSILGLFDKIKALATEDTQTALVLSGMVFTLVIWVFSFLSLILAALFFIFFLWHYIPRSDGGISGYCERKANKRLMKIVSIKINKAMAEDERRRKKAELKTAKKNGGDRPISMKPTLPNVGDDSLPPMPGISRSETMTTMTTTGPDFSRPTTPGNYELNAVGRPVPPRTETTSSSVSQYSTRAPLIGSAADMGRSSSPAPSLPQVDLNNYPPMRAGTAASNKSFGAPPLNRMMSDGSGLNNAYTQSPSVYSSETMPSMPASVRPMGNGPNSYRGPGPHLNARNGSNGANYNDYSSGRTSPAPSSAAAYQQGPRSPMRSTTNPMPPRGIQPYSPARNMTAPLPRHQQNDSMGSMRSAPGLPYPNQPRSDYDYRPGTASSQRTAPRNGHGNGWNQDVERGQGPRY